MMAAAHSADGRCHGPLGRAIASFWLSAALLILLPGPLLASSDLPSVDPAEAAAERTPYALMLDDKGRLVRQPRASIAARSSEALLRAFIEAVLSGPTAAEAAKGYGPVLPVGTVLDRVEMDHQVLVVSLTLPAETVASLDADSAQSISDLFRVIALEVSDLRGVSLLLRAPGEEPHRPLGDLVPVGPPVPPKPGETGESARSVGQPPGPGQAPPSGYLDGKSIFLSAGHGWIWSAPNWALQRGITHEMVEDLANVEAVHTYLVDYLTNAGAGVYTTRERDFNSEMIVVDEGAAVTTGPWLLDPAAGYGGSSLRVAASSTETATATFTPTIVQPGSYHVSIWYEGGPLNATDVQITIHHGGGQTTLTRDMTRDGYTWLYLGRYHCPAPPAAAGCAVSLSNLSVSGTGEVVADAVRFGGGTGSETPFGETTPSGKPRFEEGGAYHAHFMGCPATTCTSNSVSSLSRYAKWESETWEDSIYLSWHSNACGFCGARGTSTWVYGNGPPGGGAPFAGVPGSVELSDAVRNELVNDLRARFEPGWIDRGTQTAYFGELNPAYNDEMPATLIELAFHDQATDALYLRDPVFRQVAARAVYQGIVNYFATRDGDPSPTLLPEPPRDIAVVNVGDGTARLSWNPPLSDTGNGLLGDAASGYRIYRSSDGLAFDNGTDVAGGATVEYVDSGIPTGETVYYRLTATNAGGESFPTETLGVTVHDGAADLLVVAGYDRIDHFQNVPQFIPELGGTAARGFVDRMNAYNYMRYFGAPLDALGVPFDSASNEAVIEGRVALGGYAAVIWQTGEEASADHTLDSSEQSLLELYLTGGGNLFLSGSEIGWDLVDHGNGVPFYNDWLKSGYVGDDSGSYDLAPVPSGIFAGNAAFAFDDGSHGEYDANFPDDLQPIDGAAACLDYTGGTNGVAGVQYSGSYGLVYFGFPFETITDANRRMEVMEDILGFFGLPATPPPPVPDGVIGPAMRAVSLDIAGSSIGLTWDVALCPAEGYHLLYGELGTVATLTIAGAECGIAPSGATTWPAVPPQDLWFLMVADDAGSVEGGWGSSTVGPRRPGVASGQCGLASRDDTGTCP